jgi:TPR repeat protein
MKKIILFTLMIYCSCVFSRVIEQGYSINDAYKFTPRQQNQIAIMYSLGDGIPQNYDKAAKWYLKSANQGYTNAQFNLAVAYYHGRGVLQSYTKSIEWYTKAADNGCAQAQVNLGEMYTRGIGHKKYYQKAFNLFSRAAIQNDAEGQRDLAVMYLNGYGVDYDNNQAYIWASIASHNGSKLAEGMRKVLGSKLPARSVEADNMQARKLALIIGGTK